MQTVLQKAIDDLRNSPDVVYTNKAIADWLESLLVKEKTQLINAYIDGTISTITDKMSISGENYFKKKYE